MTTHHRADEKHAGVRPTIWHLPDGRGAPATAGEGAQAALAALGVDACHHLPPQRRADALLTGLPGSMEALQALIHTIDELRCSQPRLPLLLLVPPGDDTEADPSLTLACRSELLPRATLTIASHEAALAFLGGSAPGADLGAQNTARKLQALGCDSVLINGTGPDGQDHYAATPQTCGWLSIPMPASPGAQIGLSTLAACAAAALACGYVSMEALVLAVMADTHARRHAGQPMTPAPDCWTRDIRNLPGLSLPSASGRPRFDPAFAPLSNTELGLYAVVDSADWIARVLAAGVRTVQLRIKDATQPDLREQVRLSVAAARQAGAQLFINDHWQVALEEGAYGVHLGQEDLATADLEALAHAGVRLGISTHAYWEVCRAWALQPSYIACGPIHATQSKDMPWLPQGNGNLAYWSTLLPLPVVGIAGMTAERIEQAAQCAAAGAAVITAITAAPSPEAAIATMQTAFVRGKAHPPLAIPALARPTLRPAITAENRPGHPGRID